MFEAGDDHVLKLYPPDFRPRVDPGDLAATPIAGVAPWPQFIQDQAARCGDLHQSRGLSAAWGEQIPSFLQRAELTPVERPSLLHTEITRTHVFVRQGEWEIEVPAS